MKQPSRCALVTGASSGIGAAFARRLARDGFDLVLIARREERLKQLADELLGAHGIRARVLVADLTTDSGIARVTDAIAQTPAMQFVVNNAGFGGYKPFVQLTDSEIDDLIAVHVRSVARITRASVAAMQARGGGVVLNIASLLSLSGSLAPDPLPYRAVYAGAKAFIVVFSRTLARELEQTKVRIYVCLPGVVATEFHGGRSLGSEMSAEDVVTAAMASIARNETVCVPPLEDAALFDALVQTERAIFSTARNSTLADRYK